MAETNQDEKLSLLQQLAKRNTGLDKQLKELIGQYEKENLRNEQYTALLREFGLADESGKDRQGVRRFKMVSMLYVVIKGFTTLTHCEDSQEQLDRLDEIFFIISDIAQKNNLTKIPTVGDNVLLAGGITTENKTNPIDVAVAAEKIVRSIKKYKEENNTIWDVAIGIHTGPIVARYAQKKNNPYTLAGNNVLTVSRLGRAAGSGEIVVSPMTFELIKEFYQISPYGRIPVKYSGVMDIFRLGNMLPELVDADGNLTDEYDLRYSRLQFMDIQEFMLDMLEEQLPHNLYYHNVKHTIDVTTEVELIGWAEGLSEKDIMLLKVAALFHDSGQIKCSKGHEEVSCEYAQKILPKYNYPQKKIDEIKRIIMATQLPHEPSDTLEAVIQDSDLDYLGRTDFVPVSNMLYKELTERGAQMTMNQWNKAQIKFISDHQYYTQTAKSLREVNKQSQIERLKELVEECDRNGVE